MDIDDPKTMKEAYRLIAGITLAQQLGLEKDNLDTVLTVVDRMAESMLTGELEKSDDKAILRMVLEALTTDTGARA